MTDIHAVITELRALEAKATSAPDAKIACAARNALPQLLAYIEKLEADNHELRHSLDRASSYAEDITIPNVQAMWERIAKLEAVASAAK